VKYLNPQHQRLREAAKHGIPAHARLTAARSLRKAARDLDFLGQDAAAESVRRIARNLDAQRRRIMAKGVPA
jgi:hypothetical protein